MTDRFDSLVVGGGFRSIIAAYGLAKSGQSVALIESGKTIGGFLSPMRWDEYWIDKGPQFFDNFEPADWDLMIEMVGEDIFEDIGFSYGSYMGGVLTDNYAIPDWRQMGETFTQQAFQDLLTQTIRKTQLDYTLETPVRFSDLIQMDGGALLAPYLTQMAQKMLRVDPQQSSPRTAHLVTFLGRKVLFDQETAVDLKKSPLLDSFIAAQKASVSETRYNLYPRGSNLEKVRAALEKCIRDLGVTVLTETTIQSFDPKTNTATLSSGTINYGKVFMGTDVRDSESIMFKDTTIAAKTHVLPEIFHCFVVERDAVNPAYYVMNYEPDHVSSRITNFCHYMNCVDDDGYGVICIEQPIDRDSPEWESPDKDQARVFKEAQIAKAITCDNFKKARSFKVPSTYKIPLYGIEDAVSAFTDRVTQEFGDSVILPDAHTLTRKETIDNLRDLNILQ